MELAKQYTSKKRVHFGKNSLLFNVRFFSSFLSLSRSPPSFLYSPAISVSLSTFLNPHRRRLNPAPGPPRTIYTRAGPACRSRPLPWSPSPPLRISSHVRRRRGLGHRHRRGVVQLQGGLRRRRHPQSRLPLVKVVGSIEQTGDTDEAKPEKEADSASDPKNGSKPMDVDKAKTKRKFFVGQELEFRRDHMELISPMKDGSVTDWDVVDNIWNHAFRRRLLINPEEHPMLIAEPSTNSGQQREKAAELMFEKYKVPALFLAKNAVCISQKFSHLLLLGVPHLWWLTVVALLLWFLLCMMVMFCKSLATSPIGGEFLTDCMMKSLESKGVVIRPRYSFKKKEVSPGDYKVVDLDFPNTTDGYRLYCMRAIASDIKESVSRVPDTPFDEVADANVPTNSYELPDGQTIEVGAERFKIPDILFNPYLSQTIPGVDGFGDSTSIRGLPRMVLDSVNRCDVDIRKELLSSILLSGGSSSILQLKERLEKEVMEESPQNARVKVLASGNATERRFSVWIGGSILASLGSFQQMWFSKAEYEEHGVSYIQRKCP
ncbi:hypothetical protein ACQ4PT_017580 [Festuca glaucescens]